MKNINALYAVYVSPLAVEVFDQEQSIFARGRFICKQSDYDSILRFARNLASNRHVPLRNYVQGDG